MFTWYLLTNSYSENWWSLDTTTGKTLLYILFSVSKPISLYFWISRFGKKPQSFQRICCTWSGCIWIFLGIIWVTKQKGTHEPSNKNLNKKAQVWNYEKTNKHTFGWTSSRFLILPIRLCHSTLSKSQLCVPCDLCGNAVISLANFSIKLCRCSSNFVNYDISQLAGTISQPL